MLGSHPQQQGYLLGKRRLKPEQLQSEIPPINLDGPMRNLRKRNTLLIFQFIFNFLANLLFSKIIILNLTASPVRIDLNPKILILLQIIINLEGQIMFPVPQQYLEHHVVL